MTQRLHETKAQSVGHSGVKALPPAVLAAGGKLLTVLFSILIESVEKNRRALFASS